MKPSYTVTSVLIVKVTDWFSAKSPIVHLPLPGIYSPTSAVEPTYLNPAGNLSIIYTPVASWGPLLVTLIVHVTIDPWEVVLLDTVFTTVTSG